MCEACEKAKEEYWKAHEIAWERFKQACENAGKEYDKSRDPLLKNYHAIRENCKDVVKK